MELQPSQEFLDTLFDGVYFVDRERKISFWNRAAETITGYTKAEVVGSFCYDNILRHVDELGCELCLNGCPLQASMGDGEIREHLVYLHHKQGHRLPVYVRAVPVQDGDGKIIGAIEVFEVKTETNISRSELEKYKKESFTDALTETGNRRYAEIVLQTRFYELKEQGIPFGVVFFDLDHFKTINDQYGHLVGDDVLRMVSQSIKNALRGPDTVIRWGGDEFMAILPNVTEPVLEKIVRRIQTLVKRSYLMVEKHKITINLSIGATTAFSTDSVETLLNRADSLMYQGKQNGRNQAVFG